MTKDITSQLWQHVENSNTKLSKRVLNWLNYDWLNSIQLDKNVFWIEYNYNADVPNYIHHYIVKFGEKLGYRYLYNSK